MIQLGFIYHWTFLHWVVEKKQIRIHNTLFHYLWIYFDLYQCLVFSHLYSIYFTHKSKWFDLSLIHIAHLSSNHLVKSLKWLKYFFLNYRYFTIWKTSIYFIHEISSITKTLLEHSGILFNPSYLNWSPFV